MAQTKTKKKWKKKNKREEIQWGTCHRNNEWMMGRNWKVKNKIEKKKNIDRSRTYLSFLSFSDQKKASSNIPSLVLFLRLCCYDLIYFSGRFDKFKLRRGRLVSSLFLITSSFTPPFIFQNSDCRPSTFVPTTLSFVRRSIQQEHCSSIVSSVPVDKNLYSYFLRAFVCATCVHDACMFLKLDQFADGSKRKVVYWPKCGFWFNKKKHMEAPSLLTRGM